jgi:hypothetical protein
VLGYFGTIDFLFIITKKRKIKVEELLSSVN